MVCINRVCEAAMETALWEHTLWELIVLLLLTPVALTAGTLAAVHQWCRRLDGYCDPRALGRIAALDTVELIGPCIGHLGDVPILACIAFGGSRFYYDRMVIPAYQSRLQTDELFIAPGLVYRAAGATVASQRNAAVQA